MQLSVDLAPRWEVGAVKLGRAIAFQDADVQAAAAKAHAQLERLGIRHLFVGGLAVGAHGYVRAARDVGFLVGEDAFEVHGGGLVTFKPGVPIYVGGVSIDYLAVDKLGEHMRTALDHPEAGDGLPVVAI